MPPSVIYFDLDDFKKLNPRFTEPVIDRTLLPELQHPGSPLCRKPQAPEVGRLGGLSSRCASTGYVSSSCRAGMRMTMLKYLDMARFVAAHPTASLGDPTGVLLRSSPGVPPRSAWPMIGSIMDQRSSVGWRSLTQSS